MSESTKQQDHRIVIVGAGPVGLALALILARYGVPSLILEARAAPTPQDESRAITWMPKGLELLDWLGLTEEFARRGVRRTALSSLDRRGPLMDTSEQLHTNKATMKRIVDIFSTGDLSQIDAVIAPDYLDHQGLGGVAMHGQAGFRQVVTVARTALPHLQVAIHDLIAEDDKVVARLRWHSHDPAGKMVARETIEILRFHAGQAVEHWGAESWMSENSPSDQAQ